MLLGTVAHANMAASSRSPAVLSLDPHQASTVVEVVAEQLVIDCGQAKRELACSFEATYQLRNPTADAVELDPMFLGMGTSGVQVQLDANAPVALQTPHPKAPEARDLEEVPGDEMDPGYAVDRYPFHLSMAPGQARQVTVRGTMALRPRFLPEGYVLPALQARHPWMAESPPREEHYDVDYLLGPIRSWAGDPEIQVTVRAPEGWRVGTSPDRRARTLPEATGWTQRGGTATRTFKAHSAPAVMNVTLTRPKDVVSPGGVQVALGSSLGRDARFTARVGYQFGTGPWLLHSLSLESDFRDQVVLTPLVQVATPQLILIPSAGVGIGVPLQLAGGFRPGGRVLVDLHFFVLGVVFAWDYYPALGDATARSQITLMGQVSL